MVKILPKNAKRNWPAKNLIPFCVEKRGLRYRKLPEQPLKLSVLKLDGTSFSFHVVRNATVGRLKLAIEEEFSLSRKDEREHLWSLVWSHFCLCYEGQLLISEKSSIQKYGIKDGDQLYFIKHLRIELAPYPLTSKYQDCSETNARDIRVTGHVIVEDDLKYLHYGEELANFPVPKWKLTRSLKELLSCSRILHLK